MDPILIYYPEPEYGRERCVVKIFLMKNMKISKLEIIFTVYISVMILNLLISNDRNQNRSAFVCRSMEWIET